MLSECGVGVNGAPLPPAGSRGCPGTPPGPHVLLQGLRPSLPEPAVPAPPAPSQDRLASAPRAPRALSQGLRCTAFCVPAPTETRGKTPVPLSLPVSLPQDSCARPKGIGERATPEALIQPWPGAGRHPAAQRVHVAFSAPKGESGHRTGLADTSDHLGRMVPAIGLTRPELYTRRCPVGWVK